jgi:hypothetical protein
LAQPFRTEKGSKGSDRARSRRVALDRPAKLVVRLPLFEVGVFAAVGQKCRFAAVAQRGDRSSGEACMLSSSDDPSDPAALACARENQ